ncbi:MAG: hypothetical protein DSZ28_04060 [Thiothrix sp.]|nr:MAG: hypothetical protein DSZ28_04060 [Thiothrix sp.]
MRTFKKPSISPFLISLNLQSVLFILLCSGIAGAAVEPRIVGGFVEDDPKNREFMAYLRIERPEKAKTKNDTVILTLDGAKYSADWAAGSQSAPFSGKLVDCGTAETPCEEVSGSVCLIRQGNTTPTEKVHNCQAGGGFAAILVTNQTSEAEELTEGTARSLNIPAVSVSAREGSDFFSALGRNVSSEGRTGRDSFACGGTLIEQDWVLTAAHCVEDADSVVVLLGGQDVTENSREDFIAVKRILPHQGFSRTTKQHDIALLQLEKPANNKTLDRIDSASLKSAVSSGATAYSFGRGVRASHDPVEQKPAPPTRDKGKLFVVALPLVATDVCQDRIGAVSIDAFGEKYPGIEELGSGQLCAGGIPDGGKGSCYGDSGGPLTVAKNDGSIYLAGVTSWGLGCAHPGSPDIYTHVPAYAQAIDDVISGKSKQLKGDPVDEETSVLGESGQQGGGGGGAFNSAWWILLAMLRRRQLKAAGFRL